MTLPNKLTLGRIMVIPVMVILYYIPWFQDRSHIAFANVSWLYIAEVILFALASLTDFLDGYLARKKQLITTFGKFADPLADKILTFSAMTILMLDGHWPFWVFVIILVREFMVSGIRLVAAQRKNETIAAGWVGKFKTFTTMIAIIVLFFGGAHQGVEITGLVLAYIACLLTVISGVLYFWHSKDVILEEI